MQDEKDDTGVVDEQVSDVAKPEELADLMKDVEKQRDDKRR